MFIKFMMKNGYFIKKINLINLLINYQIKLNFNHYTIKITLKLILILVFNINLTIKV